MTSLVGILIITTILFNFQDKPSPLLWKWTGLGESVHKNSSTVTETEPGKTITKTTTTDELKPAKTLWDWMSLLLAPATLATLGYRFQRSQAQTTIDRAADQQHEEALQNYLKCLSELLVDKKLKQLLPKKEDSQTEKSEDKAAASATVSLSSPSIDAEAAASATVSLSPSIDAEAAVEVIKARSLSLLRMFDEDIPRKASVLSFLGDADLLTILDLDLEKSNWENANLKRVNLREAKLRKAHLDGVYLRGAHLEGACLEGAHLEDACLESACLEGANLESAHMERAHLERAHLEKAYLVEAYLKDANLKDANLEDANLERANLEGAKGINPEQVKRAKNWEKAKYDLEFRAQLGLKSEPDE